jgi:hypothetical protein
MLVSTSWSGVWSASTGSASNVTSTIENNDYRFRKDILNVGHWLQLESVDPRRITRNLSFRCAAISGRVHAARPQGCRAECFPERAILSHDCGLSTPLHRKVALLTVPPKHVETALHSLAVLHEVFRRIGMPLSDARVKVNSLECRYTEIH